MPVRGFVPATVVPFAVNVSRASRMQRLFEGRALPRLFTVLAACSVFVITVPAMAKGMHLLSAEPRPDQVMSGSGVAFALHFDQPLDHQVSTFMLTGIAGPGRTVPVRLQSQPNVLYGSVGQLTPGRYTLNWSARSSAGESLTGAIPFMVGPAH